MLGRQQALLWRVERCVFAVAGRFDGKFHFAKQARLAPIGVDGQQNQFAAELFGEDDSVGNAGVLIDAGILD